MSPLCIRNFSEIVNMDVFDKWYRWSHVVIWESKLFAVKLLNCIMISEYLSELYYVKPKTIMFEGKIECK